jgi:hypothetical protein
MKRLRMCQTLWHIVAAAKTLNLVINMIILTRLVPGDISIPM